MSVNVPKPGSWERSPFPPVGRPLHPSGRRSGWSDNYGYDAPPRPGFVWWLTSLAPDGFLAAGREPASAPQVRPSIWRTGPGEGFCAECAPRPAEILVAAKVTACSRVVCKTASLGARKSCPRPTVLRRSPASGRDYCRRRIGGSRAMPTTSDRHPGRLLLHIVSEPSAEYARLGGCHVPERDARRWPVSVLVVSCRSMLGCVIRFAPVLRGSDWRA